MARVNLGNERINRTVADARRPLARVNRTLDHITARKVSGEAAIGDSDAERRAQLRGVLNE